jgi:transposase InsO family protein
MQPGLFAAHVGMSRSMLYYEHKQEDRDWHTKCLIEEILREFPSYGHKRLALHLNINKKRVLRVMKLYGIKPYRSRGAPRKKERKIRVIYPNLLMREAPKYPGHIWAADFTYLSFQGRVVYVATVLDLYTREIVGWSILNAHPTLLVVNALMAALAHHPRPTIFHSDNGSEYNAKDFLTLLHLIGTHVSRSKPGCPWENGYQESFYSQFKIDLGDPNRFQTLGELVYEIHHTIHRYNHLRIHSALKMAPKVFAQKQASATLGVS